MQAPDGDGEEAAMTRQPQGAAGRQAFRSGPPVERTPWRDNLEYIAALLLIVLVLRQLVVEAFRIQHGSMAPTLVGVHKEMRCPNCGWTLSVGRDKESVEGEVECPNCRHVWPGASVYERGENLAFRRPAWLWNTAHAADGTVLSGTDAANRIPRGAARIFVNKFVYNLRAPRRWEVVVFLYPAYEARCADCDWTGSVTSLEGLLCPYCGSDRLHVSTKNFIKRVVGLPGERIELRDGDVHADGRIVRKPPQVQASLWMPVFDSRFVPREAGQPVWDLGGAADAWRLDEESGRLTVDARGHGDALAAYARRVKDHYAYDGVSYDAAPSALGAAGRYEVGDVRIRARVRVLEADADAAVLLAIEDAGRSFLLSLGAGTQPGAVLRDGEEVLSTREYQPLAAGRSTWVVLENYDDRLVACVDGREVFRLDYRGEPGGRRAVRFGARGAQVAWERVIIERDVYYCNMGGDAEGRDGYEVGDGEYFVLGDNSPASSDSRMWPRPGVPAANIIGRAFFVFWPIHGMKWL